MKAFSGHDNPESTRGFVFNIQHYSIHDGPGIRTTVFLKGCPLRCCWCQNPESWHAEPEIFFDPDKCTAPVHCMQACPAGAIRLINGNPEIDREICRKTIHCGWKCVEACDDGAFELTGRSFTAREVFLEVESDAIFYAESSGGVTLGGGEPLMQPRFASSILKLCRDAGFHTALDTSGYADWEVLRNVLSFVDLIMLDFKHMDSAAHVRLTGMPNERILENAKRICRELDIQMRARVPIIPGCNDSSTNIEATARFIASELDVSVPVYLLKFNRLGSAKYERLGRSYACLDVEPPNNEQMQQAKRIVEAYGLSAFIGG